MARSTKATDGGCDPDKEGSPGSIRGSGLRPKPPHSGEQRRSVVWSRLILFATREEELVTRFEACLPKDVRVLALDDVFSLLEMMQGYEGDDPTLIIDERNAMFRPETIAALSASLPAQANVLLWGIDDEALSRVEIQSPERRFFVAASDTTIEMLASMCWPRLSEDETTPATAPRPARRILLVDDDHTFARSLSRLLKTAGYEMTVAHGGHEALDLCRDGRFGAILTDLQMPGMNGLSFAAMVRLAMGKSAPKIVMITASASTVESDDLLDGLMQKPVATSTLLSLLKKLVPEEEEEASLE